MRRAVLTLLSLVAAACLPRLQLADLVQPDARRDADRQPRPRDRERPHRACSTR